MARNAWAGMQMVPGTGTKTHGQWRDSTGTWRGSMTSGRDEHVGAAADLLRQSGIRRPPPEQIVTTEDVELKVAAIMRKEQLSDVTLVINHKPCGWDKPDWELSCDKLLPRVLRADQRLTVEESDGFKRTYVGGQQ